MEINFVILNYISFSVLLINNVILIQMCILILIVVFRNNYNLYYGWIILVLYLVSICLYYFSISSYDIFIFFLWIVELTLSLIFLFLMFYIFNYIIQFNKNIYIYNIFFSSFFIINFFFFFKTGLSFLNFFEIWGFFTSWYNYYDIYHFSKNIELFQIYEIYFHYNSFEFLVLNYIIFIAILVCIFFFSFLKKFKTMTTFNNFFFNITKYKLKSTFYFRYQKYWKQSYKLPVVKIWTK